MFRYAACWSEARAKAMCFPFAHAIRWIERVDCRAADLAVESAAIVELPLEGWEALEDGWWRLPAAWGRVWRRDDGWEVRSAGHAQFDHPYHLVDPEGRVIVRADGRGWASLRDAQRAVDAAPVPKPAGVARDRAAVVARHGERVRALGAEGLTAPVIAQRLRLSETTVRRALAASDVPARGDAEARQDLPGQLVFPALG